MFDAAFHVGVMAQLILGLACMVVVVLVAPQIVHLLFGPRYEAAVLVLMILAGEIPVHFILFTYATAFYSREHILRQVTCMAIASVVCVVSNLVLTPAFGVKGAAIATICTQVVLLLLYFFSARRHIDVCSTFRVKTVRRSVAYIAKYRAGAAV